MFGVLYYYAYICKTRKIITIKIRTMKDIKKIELDVDLQMVADGLRMTKEKVKKFFYDGRRFGFIAEDKVETIYGGVQTKNGSSFDVYVEAKDGQPEKKVEVRSLTKSGIYFSPSGNVGKGRKFSEVDLLKKLDSVDIFVMCDVKTFVDDETFELVEVSSDTIRGLYFDGKLGKNAKISYKKAIELFF